MTDRERYDLVECRHLHSTQFADPTPEGIARNLPAKALEPLGTFKCLDCGALFTHSAAETEREQIARTVERMYSPHDRRFKTAIEIADAIRKGKSTTNPTLR